MCCTVITLAIVVMDGFSKLNEQFSTEEDMRKVIHSLVDRIADLENKLSKVQASMSYHERRIRAVVAVCRVVAQKMGFTLAQCLDQTMKARAKRKRKRDIDIAINED